MTFSTEEGSNYLLFILCSLLVIVLSLILCGIPCRTFPRSHTTRLSNPTSPSTPSPATKAATPVPSQQNAPLDLPPFIPSIHPVTPIPPYPTSQQSPYRAPPYTPQSPQSPQTPLATASPPRFVINTNQNLYDSQRLRGPKF
jgi:hypothetical protein